MPYKRMLYGMCAWLAGFSLMAGAVAPVDNTCATASCEITSSGTNDDQAGGPARCIKACVTARDDDCIKKGEEADTAQQASECVIVHEGEAIGEQPVILQTETIQMIRDDHEVKIMKRSDGDGVQIQLWVDGKEFTVGSDDDVQAVLKELGCDDV